MSLICSKQHYLRGLVSKGDLHRLNERLKSSERPIVYGAMGGSITQGAAATSSKACYVQRFGAWLNEKAPAGCTTINAGIGASNSLFGAFRVGDHLLKHHPDVITIEYAVNDVGDPDIQWAYEGLVRQCILQPQHPIVILIFTMRKNGQNCQAEHIPIGHHYDLPMISYRDAIYPDIESGQIAWEAISPDEVHPNDVGHAFIADLLKRLIEDREPASFTTVEPWNLAPLHPESAKYVGGQIVDASRMHVSSNIGWTQGPHKGGFTGYHSQTPGAVLTLSFEGRVAILGYKKYAGDFGRVEVTLDDEVPFVLEGYYEKPAIQAWAGGHTILHSFLDCPIAEKHQLRLRLLEARHPESHGHAFDFGYLLLS